MELGLAGKKALVTGGTHGIGQAVVKALAAEGCHVAYFSRDQKRVDATNEAVKPFGVKHLGMVADALEQDSLHSVFQRIQAEWGGVHLLVNNVGGGGRWGQENILETDDMVWKDVFQKNVWAALFFTKSCLPFMLQERYGRVVTIASIYGKEAGGRPWFNLAKAGEIALMKNLSQKHQFAMNHITFNSVAPGGIYIEDTGWADEMRADPEKYQAHLASKYPMERLGTPEEVADLVVFLCSVRASLINGACITADGGESSSY